MALTRCKHNTLLLIVKTNKKHSFIIIIQEIFGTLLVYLYFSNFTNFKYSITGGNGIILENNLQGMNIFATFAKITNLNDISNEKDSTFVCTYFICNGCMG